MPLAIIIIATDSVIEHVPKMRKASVLAKDPNMITFLRPILSNSKPAMNPPGMENKGGKLAVVKSNEISGNVKYCCN